jgi:hypothetical protein
MAGLGQSIGSDHASDASADDPDFQVMTSSGATAG